MENNPASQAGNEGLDNLWNDENTFFGIPPAGDDLSFLDTEDPEDQKPGVAGDNKNPEAPKEKKKENDEIPEEKEKFFEEESEEKDKVKTPSSEKSLGEKEDEGDDDPADEDDPKFFTVLAQELKEKGILREIKIEEGKELTEDEFFQAQDAEVETRAEEIIEAIMKDLDEDAKDFLNFKKAGGSTKIFLEQYFNNFTPELDMAQEAQQVVAVRQYLSQVLRQDDEEVENQIQYLKDGGKLAENAAKYYTKLQEIDAQNKAEVMQQVENSKLRAKQTIEKFHSDVDKAITEADQIGSFSFVNEDKKGLKEYMLKATIKVDKAKYITPLQKKLNDIFANPDKKDLVLLSKILKSDFNVDDVVIKTESKKAEKAKANLQQAKNGKVTQTKRPPIERTFADYF